LVSANVNVHFQPREDLKRGSEAPWSDGRVKIQWACITEHSLKQCRGWTFIFSHAKT